METIIRKYDAQAAENKEIMEMAGRILREGGLVAFPTETVYGLGGDALNPEASARIYAAKGRPSDNPLIVHIADTDALDVLSGQVPAKARILADRFWPGPLTMILPKSDLVPRETTGGLDTVAIRMPSHPVAADLIRSSGVYIAAPSANLSGRPSPTRASHVIEDLSGRIDMIIDGGHVEIGLESTIVDLTVDPPMILRPGYITKAMLEEAVGPVDVDAPILADMQELAWEGPDSGDDGPDLSADPSALKAVETATEPEAEIKARTRTEMKAEAETNASTRSEIEAKTKTVTVTERKPEPETKIEAGTEPGPGRDTAMEGLHPKAPGMKYRHYAPKGQLLVVEGEREAVARRINQLALEAQAAGKRTAVLCSEENRDLYSCSHVITIGSVHSEESIAANLFDVLRRMDEEEMEQIFSESYAGSGLSAAIMNRLLKAAGHRVIRA